jgi:hypothetical protein
MPCVLYCQSIVVSCYVGLNVTCAAVVLIIDSSAIYDECMRMWVMLLYIFAHLCGHICCYICYSNDMTCMGTRHSRHRFSIYVFQFFSMVLVFFVWAYTVLFDYTCNEKKYKFMSFFCRFQLIGMPCFMCVWLSYRTLEFAHVHNEVNVHNIEPLTERDLSAMVSRIAACSYIPTPDETCCICHGSYVKPVTLFCMHPYCLVCITEWVRLNHTCPICRRQINGE